MIFAKIETDIHVLRYAIDLFSHFLVSLMFNLYFWAQPI